MTTVASNPSTEQALRYCRDVTRRRARNFYYGLKLLPEPQRSAMYAIYAWMRRADDLVDDAGDRARHQLEELRNQTLRSLDDNAPMDDPVFIGLQETARRFPLEAEPFEDMLQGQIDDLESRHYATFDDLREYCQRVASSVGLICISIWGYENQQAPLLAIDRGIAFQLTNILRDFNEDYDSGRVYLPAEDFDWHGLTPQQVREWSNPDAVRRFFAEQVKRADSFYVRSAPLETLINPACRPTLWAMTQIYYRLLGQLQRNPARLAADRRVRLNSLEKASIAFIARFNGRRAGNDEQRRRDHGA